MSQLRCKNNNTSCHSSDLFSLSQKCNTFVILAYLLSAALAIIRRKRMRMFKAGENALNLKFIVRKRNLESSTAKILIIR